MLPTSAPHPYAVTKRTDDELSQIVLEQCYLPFAASAFTTIENAKVSILVESLLRMLWRLGGCEYTSSLQAAVEKGILARENRVRGDRRRKDVGSRNNEEGLLWLKASGQRMRSQLAFMKLQARV